MKNSRKQGSRKISSDAVKVQRKKPIEDDIHLADYVEFQMRGRKVGAALLEKSGTLQFRFGFYCKGIHPTLKEEQVESAFDALEAGLKSLPPGEHLTLKMGSFTSDGMRQQQLTQLCENAPLDQLQILLMSEKSRVQELTLQGIRKPKYLHCFVTSTLDTAKAGSSDKIEAMFRSLQEGWQSFTGEIHQTRQRQYEEIFNRAFSDFQNWEQLLSTQMGFELVPMSVEDLFRELWSEFNNSPPPEVPQKLIVSESGFREEVRSQVHVSTLLFESHASLPKADRQWVAYKNRFVAVMTLLDKPAGWSNKFAQLRYLWELLSRDLVYDTEIVCTLSRANDSLIKTDMQRLQKQSNVAQQLSQQKNSIDVMNQIRTRKAVAAQEQLYEGNVPLNLSLVILVHRSSTQKLEEACRYIRNCFHRPAWVDREEEYAWKTWLQCQPQLSWDRPLTKPFNRQMVFLNSEAPGLMPLIQTRPLDRQGFELIAEEGGTPIHLNLFTAHRNLFIGGTTRSGKSVCVSGILTQALSQNIPVVAIDFPKQDGSSTFSDYTRFMGKSGAYFDITREANNLFELPDLRHLPADDREVRLNDYKAFLSSALMTMIFGSGGDMSAETRLLRQTIRSVLNLAISAFFADSQIQNRYALALEQGLGTPAWNQTPTLRDFLYFCHADRIPELAEITNVDTALQQIRLRVNFWLDSSVGRSISTPSTFRTDAPLLVFALTGLSDDEDAAILSLSCYSAAVRRALSSPASIFFIDEAPILFRYEDVAKLVARLCANGAKAGIRVILSAQDPVTIARSESAADIFPNLSTKLIGRIQPAAVDNYVNILKIPRHIIQRNAGEAFFPKRESIYSQWLLEDAETYTFCRYYPPYFQLAAVANNPDEQMARTAFMKLYDDPLEGLAAFATEYISALKDGRPICIPSAFSEESPERSLVSVF